MVRSANLKNSIISTPDVSLRGIRHASDMISFFFFFLIKASFWEKKRANKNKMNQKEMESEAKLS